MGDIKEFIKAYRENEARWREERAFSEIDNFELYCELYSFRLNDESNVKLWRK